MMPLYRFLILSLVIFFLGIAVLYNGLNRVPFKNMGHDPNHQNGHSSLLLNEMIGTRAV
jgi:fatty acid desaturase